MQAAKEDIQIDWPEVGYEPPKRDALSREIARLTVIRNQPGTRKADQIAQVDRAIAGLRIATICSSSKQTKSDLKDYEILYGSKWQEKKKKIIQNSFRTDIHFLPRIDSNIDTQSLATHSVALFRYPISIPSEILTASQSISHLSWAEYLKECQDIYSCAHEFADQRPIKILSLRSSFLPDLLSRFTNLFGRIGSPDFSRDTVEQYAKEFV